MQMHARRLRVFTFLAGIAVLTFSGWASADPPSRVARLGYMNGEVSLSPAGESDWDQAAINRPLTTGDRLWTDEDARAEIQVGGAMIRMNDETGVSVLNLDDRITQLQLTQGTLSVRVRHLEPDQVFEVDTPNLAFTLSKPGEYRIEVDPDGNATTIIVRKGQGEVYGDGAAYTLDSRQPYRFRGTGLNDYEYVDAPRLDEFDRWASDRDRSYDNSSSTRYVSQDVVGYQDLDANGTWRVDASYGNVWVPNRVAADWAPYRDGHWAWVDPWGWTWVDDAPWGFAVSHYGRWANMRGTWGWVPGPVRSRAYYAPALVAFVGGSNFQLAISSGNVGGVAWFPLAPREVYRPSYKVSRGYFERINRSNTVINTTVINNTYNTTNVTNVRHVNRGVPGAVVAMPSTDFVQSQRVPKAAHRVSREIVANAPVVLAPPVAPTEKSVRGAATRGDRQPPRVFERPVVARTAPAAAKAGFAVQQQKLATQPGKPLDDDARKALKPAAAPAPVVKVVTPQQEAPTAMQPMPAAPGAKPEKGRGQSDERKPLAAPPIPGAPETPKQVVAPKQVAPPVPAAAAPSPELRDNDRRVPPIAPPPAPNQGATSPRVMPPQAPPVPAVQAPEQNGKTRQRDQDEKRGQPLTPPPAPPPGVTLPQIAPVPAKPPVSAPAAPSPEQRGNREQREQREQRERDVTPPPPPQRAAEPRPIPPQAAPQVPETQARPQRSAQPRETPPQVAPQAPESQVRPQRALQPEAPPQVAPRVPAAQAPPQRAAEPRPIPPPQAAPQAPAAQVPSQRAVQPREAPAQVAPAAQQPQPEAGSRAQQPRRDTGRPNERKNDCVGKDCER